MNLSIERIKINVKRAVGYVRYFRTYQKWAGFTEKCWPKRCDLTIVIAAHDRLAILEQVITQFSAIEERKPEGSIQLVICLSDRNEASLLENSIGERAWIHIILCPNKPLGNKWQQAVNYAKELNPNHLLVCGSDDVVSEDYLSQCESSFLQYSDLDLCAPNHWHIVNLAENVYRVKYKNSSTKQVLGAGRMYSRFFLDEIDWRLFDRQLDSGLDHRGLATVLDRSPQKLKVIDTEYTVLSVKGDWSMLNTFRVIESSGKVSVEKLENQAAKRCMKEFGLR